VGKGILDPETESQLLASEPKMDIEVTDPYKASTFTFKFVAFKSPLHLPSDSMTLPSKVFFTFKFFTFKQIQTETVLLKLPPEMEQKQQSNVVGDNNLMTSKIQLGQQYYLVKLKYI
jgi:hypothetical protein